MEKEIDLTQLAQRVWSKRKKIVRWAVVGLVVGVVIAFSIPKQYTTITKITPESKAKGSSLGAMASMFGVSTSTADNSLGQELYPEILKSSPFLLDFAEMDVVYQGEQMKLYEYLFSHQKSAWWNYVIGFPLRVVGWGRSLFAEKGTGAKVEFGHSAEQQSDFVAILSSKIDYKADKKTNIITLTSTFQDPVVSTLVADSILTKLDRYVAEVATRKTASILRHNTSLLNKAQERFYIADSTYAREVDRNQNLVTKSAQLKLERLKNDRDLAYQIYQQLSTQVEDNKIKLEEQRPIATVIEPAKVPIRPASPKKLTLIIAFAFLGGMAAVASVVWHSVKN